MKIAILTTDRPNYSHVIAHGLARMCAEIGVTTTVFDRGLSMLYQPFSGSPFSLSSYRNIARQLFFFRALRQHDVVVVVMTAPEAFVKSFKIERLRSFVPGTPIVQYSNFYVLISESGKWLRWLKDGQPDHRVRDVRDGGNYGLERYDWYLCSTLMSQTVIDESNHPVSEIGVHLDDGTLFPNQGSEFLALLDFERTDYMHERAVQIQALEDTNTPYITLNGRYTPAEIRTIYRKSSIYFLASPESFGLPICELQACGSYVFTPFASWPSAHWIKRPPNGSGAGQLSPNFVVYDNDLQTLVRMIERAKKRHDPDDVRATFLQHHPQYLFGDIGALEQFVEMVSTGKIHDSSHLEYGELSEISYLEAFNALEERIEIQS